ncbi:MAG: hypothetical protein AAB389_02880 [Patescibacteria group bacterium]
MDDTTNKKIIERLERLESTVFGSKPAATRLEPPSSEKQISLPELARKNGLKNGQQKIAAIVGYYEKIVGTKPIDTKLIQEGWRNGRFVGSYQSVLLQRSIEDGLVRDLDGSQYDLSQTGEKFFHDFINGNTGKD